MDPDWRYIFPIEIGDIPASYVSLPEGIKFDASETQVFQSTQNTSGLPRCLISGPRAGVNPIVESPTRMM